MIHARHSDRRGRTAQVRGRLRTLVAVSALALGVPGCSESGGTDPSALRFGQIGHVEIKLEAPLRLGAGRLEQTLVWSSSGSWSIHETMSYRGLEGDQSFSRSPGDPAQFASGYATYITLINEGQGIRLFVEDLPSSLTPECGPTRTRLTYTIRDDARKQEITWVRCADGSLSNITPEGAGPDPAASRLVQAALLARGATLGDRWTSSYLGSVPFGTLDRGEDSRSPLTAPATYIDAGGFQAFWEGHAPGRALPSVDFSKEMVVVGLVGVRREAGDSVEIRRVLQVDVGTLIEVFERVPGDFCSPVARTHVPYHVVVAPRTPIPHRFSDIQVEYVPCGG